MKRNSSFSHPINHPRSSGTMLGQSSPLAGSVQYPSGTGYRLFRHFFSEPAAGSLATSNLFETSNYRVFPAQLWSQKRSLRSRCFRSRTTELSTILFPVSTYTISFLLIIITNNKSKLDMCNDPKCPKVSND